MQVASEFECGEKTEACEGLPAVFFCVECAVYQCIACNSTLHETAFATPQLAAHRRYDVKELTMCDLRVCKPIAPASVTCKDCDGDLNLCHSCDESRHRVDGTRAEHRRVSCMPGPSRAGSAELEVDEISDEGSAPDLGDVGEPQKTSPKRRRAGSGQKSQNRSVSAQESFMLIDGAEKMQIKSVEELARMLECQAATPVKVVSVVGKTGDGKSFTLNQLFFNGDEVFAVSPETDSCTLGVWIAYDRKTSTVVLDTEGMMGISANSNQRVRMLLKVLAVSDIFIYKTNAGRLHTDLFTFLSDSSLAFQKHFSRELQNVVDRSKASFSANSLAPAAVVFHETSRTDLLGDRSQRLSPAHGMSGNQTLMSRFAELKLPQPEFSSLHYCGTRTAEGGDTDFGSLKRLIGTLLRDSSVRSARPLQYMLSALKHLNSKFDGSVPDTLEKMFPDEYFTCPMTCLACNSRCERTMNHELEGADHHSPGRCVYQSKLDNRVYLCRRCLDNSREEIVVPKMASSDATLLGGFSGYMWHGSVLECSHCGVIFRERKHWYGNKDASSEDAVRTEIRHVWPGTKVVGTGTNNAGRRFLESLSFGADAVSTVCSGPTRYMKDWVADSIAPSYWVSNTKITHCKRCEKDLLTDASRHHCRACGKGFCNECTAKRMPVPWRGWPPSEPVRVCEACFEHGGKRSDGASSDEDVEPPSTTPRRLGEVVATAANAVAGAMEYPKAMIKDAARPAYWVADEDIRGCCVCSVEFSVKVTLHHCRGCGEGVCDNCSQTRRKVPQRGWDMPVRVCNTCAAIEE